MKEKDSWSEGDIHYKSTRRKTIRKAVSVLIGIILLFLVLPIYTTYHVLVKIGESGCYNNIIDQTEINPKYKAVIYERNCGATTGYSYHLSLINHTKAIPEGKGNIYISNDEFKVMIEDGIIIVKDSTIDDYIRKERYKGMKIKY